MPFTEVADRVWVARYEQHDVNVSLVGGSAGLLVVDTHGSATAAREVIEDVRRLGAGDLSGIVNTHWHFDHTFGNRTFLTAYGALPVVAHETAAEELARWGPDVPCEDGTEIALPDRTFSSALTLDLGDRAVELVHPGRGHTGGDLVVRVPDADVLLAGDLVEESGPPALGDDSYPLDWPVTMELVLGLTTPATTVVPGHGAPVDRVFVDGQRDQLAAVAETIRGLAGRGVPVDEALAAGEWPWDPALLTAAVRRGYQQLPRGQRRLPLV